MPNRLASEKSPYLQQHANNPVDWYPWGDEAFERARAEEKPIFLSIGYSTCHWCHVMEHESFENEETARLMNELFVNIKVDREERPDIDDVYMTAAQALTGSGGWPLSAWLTPDLRPFFVGTYFPPASKWGRPGFPEVLRKLHDAWTNEREKVIGSAEAITQAVMQGASAQPVEGEGTPLDLLATRCFEQLEQIYDPRLGGFGGAPKFPRPSIFEFLLRYHLLRENRHALDMTLTTMRRMSDGGMYDQLGGGFARYSVDAEWRVPHFEKMLYDQGQLLATFADAHRLTGEEWLARRMRETVVYLERDLMAPDGSFYSAEDADSEGEEGTFYIWTLDELASILDERQLEAMRHRYGLTREGNFEHGKNVLHTSASIEDVAKRMEISPDEVRSLIDAAAAKLLEVRSGRVRPHRDEKVLTAWNGLMISGLARSAMALGDEHHLDLARRAARSILSSMIVDGRLMRRRRDDQVAIPGFLEDYAFLVLGLLDLFEASGEVEWLKEADRLLRDADGLFHDEAGGGYFMSAGEDPTVLVRSKSDHDGAEPSGNSAMALALVRLGQLFHDDTLTARAEETMRLFAPRIEQVPSIMPLMLAASMTMAEAPRQIAIVEGEDRESFVRLAATARGRYAPTTTVITIGKEGIDPWLAERMPTLEGMAPVGGRSAAYVCEGMMCHAPVTEL